MLSSKSISNSLNSRSRQRQAAQNANFSSLIRETWTGKINLVPPSSSGSTQAAYTAIHCEIPLRVRKPRRRRSSTSSHLHNESSPTKPGHENQTRAVNGNHLHNPVPGPRATHPLTPCPEHAPHALAVSLRLRHKARKRLETSLLKREKRANLDDTLN